MNTVLTINNLSKGFKKYTVLNGLNWQVQKGDVVGLLGKNGAGKSTLLKSLLNIHSIDVGNIELFGETHNNLSDKNKAKIGYVPQENDEIPWLTVKELVKFRKQFYQTWSDEKVQQLIARWHIDESKAIAELSPGQVQRVLIILALAPMPELLIFDEPAAALDPAARREFLKEIIDLSNDENITVIFSTHIVSDLERVANKVAILDGGNICYFDDLDVTKENVVQLSIRHDQSNKIDVPHLLRTVKTHHGQQCVVAKLDQQWLGDMHTQGIEITVNPMGLEDIFLELTA